VPERPQEIRTAQRTATPSTAHIRWQTGTAKREKSAFFYFPPNKTFFLPAGIKKIVFVNFEFVSLALM
jgi:hypothetical protein